MDLIYYIPAAATQGAALAALKGAPIGLSAATAQALGFALETHYRGVTRGPDGLAGFCATHRRPDDPDYPYQIDCADFGAETWTQFAHRGSPLWVGWRSDSPPRPAELLRHGILEGYDVLLADGNRWHVPCARKFPRTLSLDRDGNVIYQPMPRFRAFSEKVFAIGEIVFGTRATDAPIPTDRDWFDLAAQALGWNYRLGAFDCSALGLLNEANIAVRPLERPSPEWGIIEAALDFPRLRQIILDEKKKEATQSTGSG